VALAKVFRGGPLKRIAKRERALSVQEFVEAVGSGAVATLPPDATVQIVGGSP
jgi:hypothetical protein